MSRAWETYAMPRFLIEVPHAPGHAACVRAAHALLSSGSHFISRADWGCRDGVHKTWMIVEVESKGDARQIVPPAFRSDANVIELNRCTLQEARAMLEELSEAPTG